MLPIFHLRIQQYESVNYRTVKYYLTYQILTKTDYLQGSNLHGKLISCMAKLLKFLFLPKFNFRDSNKEKVIEELT